jgi:hypothetical protein
LLAPMLAQTSSPAPVFAGRMQGFYFDDLTQRGRQ